MVKSKRSKIFIYFFISNDTTFLYFFTNEVCKMEINVKGKRKALAWFWLAIEPFVFSLIFFL